MLTDYRFNIQNVGQNSVTYNLSTFNLCGDICLETMNKICNE